MERKLPLKVILSENRSYASILIQQDATIRPQDRHHVREPGFCSDRPGVRLRSDANQMREELQTCRILAKDERNSLSSRQARTPVRLTRARP